MRVTEQTNLNTVRTSMARSKGRMTDLQMQSASMKKLNKPSDDPVGAAKILEVRTDMVNNKQFVENAHLAEAFLNNTDHVLEDLANTVVRAKELALSQASGPSSTKETRVGVAEEIGQLFQHAVAVANRRVGDRYILGGYKTDQPPVDPDGRYRGDDGEMMVEISRDVFVSANIPGLHAFNSHPDASSDQNYVKAADRKLALAMGKEVGPSKVQPGRENVNVFQELQNLRLSLLTGDIEGIRSTLERFDEVHQKIVSVRAQVGSRINGIQTAMNTMERGNITNAQLTQYIEDADMAEVMGDLAKEEQVYRGTLEAGKRLIQPSLLDFLR